MDRLRYPRRADDRIFAEIAGYFGASGARCSGATPAQVEAAARFGFQAGTAIQLSDDPGDVWNDKEPHSDGLSDIRECRVTAAVAYALQHEGAAQERLRAYYQATYPPELEQLRRVRDLLEECGARLWLQKQTDTHLDAAMRILPEATSDPRTRHETETFVRGVCADFEHQ